MQRASNGDVPGPPITACRASQWGEGGGLSPSSSHEDCTDGPAWQTCSSMPMQAAGGLSWAGEEEAGSSWEAFKGGVVTT